MKNRFIDFDIYISKQLDDIFSDPAKHEFCSSYDYYKKHPTFGSRGRRLKGRKNIC